MLNADQSARMSQLALRWTMLTMVRSKETCFAEWSELENIGGANPLWRIPYQRMTPRYERLVPFSRQALRLLVELSSRSEDHTSELQALMRLSYAVFWCQKNTLNVISTFVCIAEVYSHT